MLPEKTPDHPLGGPDNHPPTLPPTSAAAGAAGEPDVAGGVAWARASFTAASVPIMKTWSLLNIMFPFHPQGLRINVMMWGMTAGPNVNARKKSAGMIGIGCLAPLILFIVGALVGHLVMGTSGVPWGAGAGFISGMALLGLLGWVLGKTRKR
jgi:hypothetical protein